VHGESAGVAAGARLCAVIKRGPEADA